MHANKVIWHGGGNIETPREGSFQCCLARKVIRKEVATGGTLGFFWTLQR